MGVDAEEVEILVRLESLVLWYSVELGCRSGAREKRCCSRPPKRPAPDFGRVSNPSLTLILAPATAPRSRSCGTATARARRTRPPTTRASRGLWATSRSRDGCAPLMKLAWRAPPAAAARCQSSARRLPGGLARGSIRGTRHAPPPCPARRPLATRLHFPRRLLSLAVLSSCAQDRRRPATIDNLVLLTHAEADAHDEVEGLEELRQRVGPLRCCASIVAVGSAWFAMPCCSGAGYGGGQPAAMQLDGAHATWHACC